jgi:hypothetical protein
MKKNLIFIYLVTAWPHASQAISMVYNFRIAQITRQPFIENTDKNTKTFVGLVFDQYRRKYDGTRQNYAGGLASFIYATSSNYFRIDTAVSSIRSKACVSSPFSGTEWDDILFTAGHNLKSSSRGTLTLSGLFGIPTHKLLRLIHPDFGYSQVGLGVQLDGSANITAHSAILLGSRYIHFFPRNAFDADCLKHRTTIGNVGDIICAYKHNKGKHGIEFGYTFRCRFGAYVIPNIIDYKDKTDYVRSNFYAVYKYKFKIKNIANRLLFNLGYGFDHTSKKFGNKSIITPWISRNVSY